MFFSFMLLICFNPNTKMGYQKTDTVLFSQSEPVYRGSCGSDHRLFYPNFDKKLKITRSCFWEFQTSGCSWFILRGFPVINSKNVNDGRMNCLVELA
jgi:hypothetical protein